MTLQELSSGYFMDLLFWFLWSSGPVVLAEIFFRSAQEVYAAWSSSSSTAGEQGWEKKRKFVRLGQGVVAFAVLVMATALKWPMELAVVWLVARFFRLNVSPADEEHFREKELLDLGPSLAINYWVPFLGPFVRGPEMPAGSPTITKLLLIPTSCTFDKSSLGQGFSDKIETKKDGTKVTMVYRFYSPKYIEHFRDDPERPVTEVVGRNLEGEEEKHLVIFDFPRTLQSSMGLDKTISDSHRQANLKCFLTKIEEQLAAEGEKGKAVKILVYDEREPGFCLADRIVRLLKNKKTD